jgi:MFS family permease
VSGPLRRRDALLLYATAFLRAMATAMVAVLLGVYLPRLGLSAPEVGLVIGAGLAGAALAALGVTLAGDRWSRRGLLVALAVLSAAGGVAFMGASSTTVAAAVAFLGMLNGMGRDRGAALVLEQAMLPATTDDAGRTQAFARYSVVQDVGHALGGLAAGLPTLLEARGVGAPAGFRVALGAYAALALAAVPLYTRLSSELEPPRDAARLVSRATRGVLWRVSSLFFLDSLAGGFLATGLLAYFFHQRFGVGAGVIGVLFAAARVLNALSHLAAAWLARRIGLLNTMVFTHVPSSLLLVTVAWAPSFWVAATLFLLREGLVEMDVPTRQSFVMAVVRPEERVLASGLTNLVRLAGWAVGPALAGVLMGAASFGAPLVVGAVMKVAYDGLLYTAFRRLRPPEERAQIE